MALSGPIRCEHHDSKDEIYSSEYRAWNAAKNRCSNPKNVAYPDYGGRGIKVCDEWLVSYKAFLSYVGRKPSPEYQLERIDNNGNYEPGNVRWASPAEQLRNTRANRVLTYNGVSLCIADWADKLRVPRSIIDTRLRRGWPIDRLFTEAPREYPRRSI